MAPTIELSPEFQNEVLAAAARERRPAEELLRESWEHRRGTAPERQVERNQRAIALLRKWRQEEPDPDGELGYPEQIEPLRLREALA